MSVCTHAVDEVLHLGLGGIQSAPPHRRVQLLRRKGGKLLLNGNFEDFCIKVKTFVEIVPSAFLSNDSKASLKA